MIKAKLFHGEDKYLLYDFNDDMSINIIGEYDSINEAFINCALLGIEKDELSYEFIYSKDDMDEINHAIENGLLVKGGCVWKR